MKRTTYVFAFLFLVFLGLGFNSGAQTVIYNQNFDSSSSYIIPRWTNSFTGAVPWQNGLAANVGGCMPGEPMSVRTGTNLVACIPDCGMFDYNNINVFSYTPGVSLTHRTGAWLKYDSYFYEDTSDGFRERATVEISTDTGRTWTILETTHQNSSFDAFETHFIDLSAYDNVADIRIGFRYSDGGGRKYGWAIDNVQVFIPIHHDVVLNHVTPDNYLSSFVARGRSYNHKFSVYNAGLDTIHTLVLNYQKGSGPIARDTVRGLNIPRFSFDTLVHSVPDTMISVSSFIVNAWATLDSDTISFNDSARTELNGAEFMPLKRLALECGDGIWNGWSPQNINFFNYIPAHDLSAGLISVHNFDVLTDTPYFDFLFNYHYNYVPFMLFDRRQKVQPSHFIPEFYKQSNYFGFANVSLVGALEANALTIDATVTPAIDLSGDYSLAMVITQSGIHGDDTTYSQVNNFSGGRNGVMPGFDTMPDPVPFSRMTYDNIARLITPGPVGGVGGLLPSLMIANTDYTRTLSATIDPSWMHGTLKAVVLLIDRSDSTILNCNVYSFSLETPSVNVNINDGGIYPNPANESVKVFWENEGQATVRLTDVSGRVIESRVFESQPGKIAITEFSVESLSPGMYIVQVVTTKGQQSFKLVVDK